MNKNIYPKLAFSNLKNNSKTYIPYLIASIFSIAMFYIMSSIGINISNSDIIGASTLKEVLKFGNYVIGLFSIIFLFYTNNFLIKRRKKELGLYNILGMEKRHIGKLLTIEVFYTSIFSIVIGLMVGIITSKLMFLVLLKLLKFGVPIKFSIPLNSIIITTILFAVIFLLTLLNNLRQIHLTKPIELLKGDSFGEVSEPKTKWLLTIIGVLSLAGGYYISLKVDSPLTALFLFFIAVILVIIGTYCLFTSGSIIVLKVLRKNKKFYYKTSNFINVSGMIYRMKQNAVGLANICILSTAVLVTLSTTVSLYFGTESILKERFKKNVGIEISYLDMETSENTLSEVHNIIKTTANDFNLKISENPIKFTSLKLDAKQDKNNFYSYNNDVDTSIKNFLTIITLDEYLNNNNKEISLNKDEILLFTKNKNLKKYSEIYFENEKFNVKSNLQSLNLGDEIEVNLNEDVYLVVSDLEIIEKLNSLLNIENEGELLLNYDYIFDTDATPEDEIAFNNKITENISTTLTTLNFNSFSLESSRSNVLSLYGGLFFIGVFLGSLFLLATILIMYYKQVSEGYEDKHRFEVMKKVGLSKKEIQRSISKQILMVFFLPLLTAVIHIAFAFKVLTKIMTVFHLTNVNLILICTFVTILIFSIIYSFAYSLTAKTYYKIVS